MIGGQRVLALITARGGSKGLPGKNVRPLGGRPLVAWSVAAARASRYVDRVVLSSDDAAIQEAARAAGADVPFTRPAALASDTATSLDVVNHALDQLPGFDLLVLLQPTSPLRTADDIDRCLEACGPDGGAPAAVSVVETDKSPHWMFTLGPDARLHRLLDGPVPDRRQDAPRVMVLNGAVYVARIPWLAQARTFVTPETVAHVMPRERSVDIDTALDFALTEQLLALAPPGPLY